MPTSSACSGPPACCRTKFEVAATSSRTSSEIDRRGSSCPTLFVWDGERYEFVADMLGAALSGTGSRPGERDIPRPAEYIKINRDAVHEKDGKLSFRFMEPLEEVVYLDQVRLLAVDHPANFDVYPNEYFACNPPYPAFKVVVSRNAQPSRGCMGRARARSSARSARASLLRRFRDDPVPGIRQAPHLTLDLGEPYAGGPLWLLMHGEIEYFTANSMYAASQAGIEADRALRRSARTRTANGSAWWTTWDSRPEAPAP